MRIGKLRHRGIIQRLVAGSPQVTPSGEPDETWTNYLLVWMSVEPLRGRELFAAQEHYGQVDTRIRVRYRSDIDDEMRAVVQGKVYDFVSIVDPELRNRELEIMALHDPKAVGVEAEALLMNEGGFLLLNEGDGILL